CTLSLCCIPDDKAAISEMHRVLREGGRLVLLDQVPSGNRMIRAGQWLFEKVTQWMTGEYQIRCPLSAVAGAGFVIQRQELLRAGMVERLTAVKPKSSPPLSAASPGPDADAGGDM
ncbi:MAG TPA: hypothetical protein VIV12_30085, partial [Streptosporangiaceae bacterium]